SPYGRFASLRHWYSRSEQTSEAAEARLLSRLQFFSVGGKTIATPGESKTVARVGLVDLDGDGVRKINTLVIDQVGNDFDVTDHKMTRSEYITNNKLGFNPESQTKVSVQSGTTTTVDIPPKKHNLDSLEKWRQVQKIEKMTLLGHSLGGYFAAVYALKYPQYVERLILVSPAGIPPNPYENNKDLKNSTGRTIPRWVIKLWEANFTPQLIMRLTGPFGPSLVSQYTSRRFAHLDEQDRIDLHDYLYHISAAPGSGEYAMSRILAPGAYARKPLMNRLENLKMPTVFMYGEEDWMDYRAAEEARTKMHVPTEVIRIPNAGHHLYLDNPVEFDKAVISIMLEVEN
ncbi:3435_t:CDS:2, partial [Acaulospora colombiana]